MQDRKMKGWKMAGWKMASQANRWTKEFDLLMYQRFCHALPGRGSL
jgi:hypothetical protein